MNPFITDPFGKGTYSAFIYNQIKNMKVGDSKPVETGNDKPRRTFAMTLQYVARRREIMFRTKTDRSTGKLWVMRIL